MLFYYKNYLKMVTNYINPKMSPFDVSLSLKTFLYLHIHSNATGDPSIIVAPWMATISTSHPPFSENSMDNNNLTYIFGCPSILIDRQAALTSLECYKRSFHNLPTYIDFHGFRYSITEVQTNNISSSEIMNDDLVLLTFSGEIWKLGISDIISFPMAKNEMNWSSCKLIQYPQDLRSSIFNFFQIDFVQSDECKQYISKANQYAINNNLTWSPNLMCSTLINKNECLKMRRYSPVVCQQNNILTKYEILAFSSRRMLITDTQCFVLFLSVLSESDWLHREIAKLTWERFSKYISQEEKSSNFKYSKRICKC